MCLRYPSDQRGTSKQHEPRVWSASIFRSWASASITGLRPRSQPCNATRFFHCTVPVSRLDHPSVSANDSRPRRTSFFPSPCVCLDLVKHCLALSLGLNIDDVPFIPSSSQGMTVQWPGKGGLPDRGNNLSSSQLWVVPSRVSLPIVSTMRTVTMPKSVITGSPFVMQRRYCNIVLMVIRWDGESNGVGSGCQNGFGPVAPKSAGKEVKKSKRPDGGVRTAASIVDLCDMRGRS